MASESTLKKEDSLVVLFQSTPHRDKSSQGDSIELYGVLGHSIEEKGYLRS